MRPPDFSATANDNRKTICVAFGEKKNKNSVNLNIKMKLTG